MNKLDIYMMEINQFVEHERTHLIHLRAYRFQT